MKTVMKFAAGFALAMMAVAQPALAAPRAMDVAANNAASTEVVGVRQSANVGVTNGATQAEMRAAKRSNKLMLVAAAAAAGAGLYFALKDQSTSP